MFDEPRNSQVTSVSRSATLSAKRMSDSLATYRFSVFDFDVRHPALQMYCRRPQLKIHGE